MCMMGILFLNILPHQPSQMLSFKSMKHTNSTLHLYISMLKLVQILSCPHADAAGAGKSQTVCVNVPSTCHSYVLFGFPWNVWTKGGRAHWNPAGRLGSCSPILNFPWLCAILIVCHLCLWSAGVRPMETWGGAAPSLSSRDRFPALTTLAGVCVTCLIKVALVSASPRFVWGPS